METEAESGRNERRGCQSAPAPLAGSPVCGYGLNAPAGSRPRVRLGAAVQRLDKGPIYLQPAKSDGRRSARGQLPRPSLAAGYRSARPEHSAARSLRPRRLHTRGGTADAAEVEQLAASSAGIVELAAGTAAL